MGEGFPSCACVGGRMVKKSGGFSWVRTDRLCGHSHYMAQEYELYTEEQLKKWYARAMPSLRILSKPIEEEKIKQSVALEAIRRFAEAFGIDPMKVRIEKQKELGREPSTEEEIQTIQNEIRKIRGHEEDPKRIVEEEELESYIAEGWDVQTVLPSGRILLRKL